LGFEEQLVQAALEVRRPVVVSDVVHLQLTTGEGSAHELGHV